MSYKVSKERRADHKAEWRSTDDDTSNGRIRTSFLCLMIRVKMRPTVVHGKYDENYLDQRAAYSSNEHVHTWLLITVE